MRRTNSPQSSRSTGGSMGTLVECGSKPAARTASRQLGKCLRTWYSVIPEELLNSEPTAVGQESALPYGLRSGLRLYQATRYSYDSRRLTSELTGRGVYIQPSVQ